MSYLFFSIELWGILSAFGINLGIKTIPIVLIVFGMAIFILYFATVSCTVARSSRVTGEGLAT